MKFTYGEELYASLFSSGFPFGVPHRFDDSLEIFRYPFRIHKRLLFVSHIFSGKYNAIERIGQPQKFCKRQRLSPERGIESRKCKRTLGSFGASGKGR